MTTPGDGVCADGAEVAEGRQQGGDDGGSPAAREEQGAEQLQGGDGGAVRVEQGACQQQAGSGESSGAGAERSGADETARLLEQLREQQAANSALRAQLADRRRRHPSDAVAAVASRPDDGAAEVGLQWGQPRPDVRRWRYGGYRDDDTARAVARGGRAFRDLADERGRRAEARRLLTGREQALAVVNQPRAYPRPQRDPARELDYWAARDATRPAAQLRARWKTFDSDAALIAGPAQHPEDLLPLPPPPPARWERPFDAEAAEEASERRRSVRRGEQAEAGCLLPADDAAEQQLWLTDASYSAAAARTQLPGGAVPSVPCPAPSPRQRARMLAESCAADAAPQVAAREKMQARCGDETSLWGSAPKPPPTAELRQWSVADADAMMQRDLRMLHDADSA